MRCFSPNEGHFKFRVAYQTLNRIFALKKWINWINNISADSLSLSLSFLCDCLSGFTTAWILLKERSDYDDDHAFDENRGGCF